MPAFLEAKLKNEYGANSKIPYMVMNQTRRAARLARNRERPRDAGEARSRRGGAAGEARRAARAGYGQSMTCLKP
jgi:hypothetical protein